MLTYQLAAMCGRYLPDGAWQLASKDAVRVVATVLIVLAYAAWYRRADKDALAPPRELLCGDRAAFVALAALCGAILQIASAAAVALVTEAPALGACEAPTDVSSALRLCSAVAVAPLCEEVVYRGVAFRLMDRVSPTALAALLTSIVFGLIHGDAISAAIACYVGFLLAITVARRRSLVPAIALHAAFNLTSFFAGYIPLSPAAALAITAPLGVLGIIVLLKGKKQ